MQETYGFKEAYEASVKYFNGNELAADVFVKKYALRTTNDVYLERTPEDMHRRLAKEFARIEKKKYKNSKIIPLTEDELFGLFDRFNAIIPQGSPMYAIGNVAQFVSTSNCFVIESPSDSYGGICKTDEEIVQISKRRGGVGTDISNLRPNKSPTSNASRTSTGIIPFEARYSNSTREVGQDGRRGALLISLSVHHPESIIPWDESISGKPHNVELQHSQYGKLKISSQYYDPNRIDFITSKYDETKVTGANISVKITDEFMKAVKEKTDYQQRWPVDSDDPKIIKYVNANAAWQKLIYSAWRTGEPGILMWDNIIRESISDCYAKFGFKSISTNPCGEVNLPAGDSCRLLLTNLFKFVLNPFTKKASFDFKAFYQCAKTAQRLMDDLIDLEIESVTQIISKIKKDPEDEFTKIRELRLWEKILEICKKGRRTGTGLTALGDTLAALNISYGSKKGVDMVDKIYKTLKFAAYESSIEMAKEIGTFPIWDHELEKDNPYLNRLKEETLEIGGTIISGRTIWNNMKKYGRRNIALLTSSPAGSVSLLALLIKYFGTSSGIEPEYALEYTRKKKININDRESRVDSVDANGDKWTHFKVYPSAVKEWMDITGKTNIEESPWHNNCALNLDWKTRVKIQATAQKHIDHSISSTVNLPHDISVDEVKKIYELAWELGCKGITVYRDGCRTGVMVTDDSNQTSITKSQAHKRPKELPCDIYHTSVKGEEYFVAVGLFGNKKEPYEVFAGKNGNIPKKFKTGILKKVKRGAYSLILDEDNVIDNIIEYEVHEEEAMTRMISTNLRHGADISFIVHQLEKTKGELTSFSKSVARTLKRYIDDGEEVKGEECVECRGTLIRQDGCKICAVCGWTACS